MAGAGPRVIERAESCVPRLLPGAPCQQGAAVALVRPRSCGGSLGFVCTAVSQWRAGRRGFADRSWATCEYSLQPDGFLLVLGLDGTAGWFSLMSVSSRVSPSAVTWAGSLLGLCLPPSCECPPGRGSGAGGGTGGWQRGSAPWAPGAVRAACPGSPPLQLLSPPRQAPDSLRHLQLLSFLLALLSEWLLPPHRGGNSKAVTGMCWERRKWCWGGDCLTRALGPGTARRLHKGAWGPSYSEAVLVGAGPGG